VSNGAATERRKVDAMVLLTDPVFRAAFEPRRN
jgi:hypothetical protein